MKLSPALADRAARISCRLLVALHLLFLVSFALAMSAVAARAEAPACGGTDLLAALAKSDPARFAAVQAEAAQQPNGQGKLWRIEKEGYAPSFLFGTMHLTDPRVLALSPAARSAFEGAQTVVIETTDLLDQAKVGAALMSEPELTMFTDATTLFSLVSPADRIVLEEGLKRLGIPPLSVTKMKPWMLSTMAAMPVCERARQATGGRVLDLKLADDALAAGKELKGLETAAEQLRAMTSLPLEYHVASLVETMRMGERVNDVVETMTVLYRNGSIGLIGPALRALFPGPVGDLNQFGFQEVVVDQRNARMVEGALPILAEGSAFVAVGALHLPGEKGIVAMLRERGYTLSVVE